MVIKKTDKKSGKTVAAERQNRKGHDMAEGIRINKYLSEAGICSRRAADEYILKRQDHNKWEACGNGAEDRGK